MESNHPRPEPPGLQPGPLPLRYNFPLRLKGPRPGLSADYPTSFCPGLYNHVTMVALYLAEAERLELPSPFGQHVSNVRAYH